MNMKNSRKLLEELFHNQEKLRNMYDVLDIQGKNRTFT